MPDLVTLESVNGNFAFCVDFYQGRAAVRANTKMLPAGVFLEPIPESISALTPGMVLMSAEWDAIYFVNIREDWRLDDYFDFAKSILKKTRRKRT